MVLEKLEYDTYLHLDNKKISIESSTWLAGRIQRLKPHTGYFRLNKNGLCLCIHILGYNFLNKNGSKSAIKEDENLLVPIEAVNKMIFSPTQIFYSEDIKYFFQYKKKLDFQYK